MLDIKIRPASIEDLSWIESKANSTKALWNSDVSGWYTLKELSKLVEPLNSDQVIFLVAQKNDHPVGFILTHILISWALCTGFYVDKVMRSQGIGQNLMSATENKLKELNIFSINLLVNHTNERAIDLYRRMGFKQGNLMYWMDKNIT